MESANLNPKCSGQPAVPTAARTSRCERSYVDASQPLSRKCAGCLFGNCSYPPLQASAVRRILRRIKRVEFERDTVLYRENQTGTLLYVMRSGLVKLVQYLPNGDDRIVRLLHSGDVAGFEALLGGAYHHMAMALNDAVACVIPTDVVTLLLDLDSGDHPFRRAMMTCWLDHLDTADRWLCGFSTGPAHARVARLIRYLVEIEQTERSGEVSLLSRNDMASILGLACESVCREISRLRSIGALRQVGVRRYACNKALLDEISKLTHQLS